MDAKSAWSTRKVMETSMDMRETQSTPNLRRFAVTSKFSKGLPPQIKITYHGFSHIWTRQPGAWLSNRWTAEAFRTGWTKRFWAHKGCLGSNIPHTHIYIYIWKSFTRLRCLLSYSHKFMALLCVISFYECWWISRAIMHERPFEQRYILPQGNNRSIAMGFVSERFQLVPHVCIPTWWLIPLSKWVITKF